MLPSTGYFKGLTCPFYDSGLCERPYCHFRHAKKESNSGGDGIENGAILQQLVSEAVKKVLRQTDASAASNSLPKSTLKLTYNPTPIAELNKIHGSDGEDSDSRPRRHIPVPYTPHRPAGAPVKRVPDDQEAVKPFIYNPPENTYTPGSGEPNKHDPYLPFGGSSNGIYKPGSETKLQTYIPPAVSSTIEMDKANYIPSGTSEKTVTKNKLIEYEPTHASVNAGMSKYISEKNADASSHKAKYAVCTGLKYQPTPLSQVPCFSSDEDEPSPKKKKKDDSDLNGLDLDNEFEMLGQILDEEDTVKPSDKSESNIGKSKGDPGLLTDKEKRGIDKEKNCTSLKSHKSLHKDREKEKQRDKEKSKDKEKDRHKEKERLTENEKNRVKEKEKDRTKEKEKGRRKEKEKDKPKEKDRTKEKDSIKEKEKDSKKEQEKDRTKEKHNIREKTKHIDKNSAVSSSSKESSVKSSSRSSEKISKNSSSSSRSGKISSSTKHHKSETSKNKTSQSHKTENQSNKCKDRTKAISKDYSEHNEKTATSDSEMLTCDTNFDELAEELSESDEDTIAMECMRIFEEYTPALRPDMSTETEAKLDVEEEYVPGKKRISRTIDKKIKVIPRPQLKPDFKISAAHMMAQRSEKVKQYHALNNISTNSVLPEKPIIENIDVPNISTPNSSKVRIAHVPNVLLYGKKPEQKSTGLTVEKSNPSTSTTAQTVPKGSSRTAHVPGDKFCDRPGVLEPLSSKIPANLRSTYLNKMIDECLKIYLIPTDAYARAQHEELITSKKCTTIQIYKNSALLAVTRLRKEIQECRGIRKASYDVESSKISHSQVLIGKLGQSSWSIEHKKTADFAQEFRGLRLYKNISQWILDEEQLQKNGFPRPHPDGEKGRAKIYTPNDRSIPPKGQLRTCCRCKKEYAVNKTGFPSVIEDCIYHPNRKYRIRGDVKYQCCGQDGTSEGCSIAPTHVYDYVDYENLRGFVQTMPKDVSDPNNHDFGVYALDCEMCYTTHGLDLTRVTVIDSACRTVYETMIKPLHPIVDYNTQYSGITEDQMANVTTTLIEVQASLLALFSDKTILIGHSLESDFKALKLIHSTVVDTSVLFPHKLGPPYKRALRNLSSEHLNKIIQNSIDGHDSAEDATVCMELVLWKLKEGLKLR